MPNTTTFEFGDVVLVPFPFTDQTTTKKRPAAVVSSAVYHRQRPDLILMAITSHGHSNHTVGEFVVQHWEAAGLIKRSMLKPLLSTIDRNIILRHLGRLHEDDRTTLRRALDEIIGR